jgi:hypothetical protein
VGDGGDFGAWLQDEAGLPCFELSSRALAADVWHQVGNDRVSATAHADGRATAYWFEEGLVRLGAVSWRAMLALAGAPRALVEALRGALACRDRCA